MITLFVVLATTGKNVYKRVIRKDIDAQEEYILKKTVGIVLSVKSLVAYIVIYCILTLIYMVSMNVGEISIKTPNQYIIYRQVTTGDSRTLVYTVDLDKDKILCREKSRWYEGLVPKENNSLVKEIIEKTVNDEDNLIEWSAEEKQIFFQQKIYNFYSIETYSGKTYYVRNEEIIQLLENALQHYYKQF